MSEKPQEIPASYPKLEPIDIWEPELMPVPMPVEPKASVQKETMEELEKRLMVDYHLTPDEIRVIRAAYLERRKELFRATRKELQDFINKDYRSANEEALGGEKGVEILQAALKIKVDGKFGPTTFRTLIDYQKKNGLRTDGVAGPRTIAKLGIAEAISGKPVTGVPSIPVVPPTVPTPSVTPAVPVTPTVPATPEVAPTLPTVANVLKKHEMLSRSIRASMDSIRASRDENTGAFNAITDLAVEFTDIESGREIYARSWQQVRAQAGAYYQDLQSTLATANLTVLERSQFEKLILTYQILLREVFEGSNALRSISNTFAALPEDAVLAGNGVIGIGKGVVEGFKHVLDLTVFLAKFTFSSEHRKAVGLQWDMIMEARKKAGGISPLISQAFQAEVARIATLPSHEQAEAIGKIFGTVLGIGGTAALGYKAGKKWVALVVASRAAKASQKAAETAAETAKAAAALAAEQATAAPTTAAATAATEEAALHTAEAARQTAAAAKLGAEAATAKAHAVALKAGGTILAGPAEAAISKSTSALFSKAYLLVRANKATVPTIEEAITKAIADNADQMKVAVEAKNQFLVSKLEKELRFLNAAQAELKSRPPKVEKPTAQKNGAKPVKDGEEIPVPHTVPKEYVYDTSKDLSQNIERFRDAYGTKYVHPDEMTVSEINHVSSRLARFHEAEQILSAAKKSGDVKAIEEATRVMENFLKNPEAPLPVASATTATAAKASPAAATTTKAPTAPAKPTPNGNKPEPEFIPRFLRKEPEPAPILHPTEYTFNPSLTVKENIRKFNRVYGPNGALRTGASPADIQRYDSYYQALNQINDVLKKATKSGNTSAISTAEADVKAFLSNPDTGIQYVKTEEFADKALAAMKASNGEAAKTAENTQMGQSFLKAMFAKSFQELDSTFSLIRYPAGSVMHIENLLCRELLQVLKDGAQSGKISWRDAVTNINSFQKNPEQFVEDMLKVNFDDAVKQRREAWARMQWSDTGR